MIRFKEIRYKNFLSTGNNFTTINLDYNGTVLITGENGNGKCLHHSTKIDICINNNEVKKKFERFINERKIKKSNRKNR